MFEQPGLTPVRDLIPLWPKSESVAHTTHTVLPSLSLPDDSAGPGPVQAEQGWEGKGPTRTSAPSNLAWGVGVGRQEREEERQRAETGVSEEAAGWQFTACRRLPFCRDLGSFCTLVTFCELVSLCPYTKTRKFSHMHPQCRGKSTSALCPWVRTQGASGPPSTLQARVVTCRNRGSGPAGRERVRDSDIPEGSLFKLS